MFVSVPRQMVFNWSLFPRPLGLLATGCFLLALANTVRGSDVFTCKMSPEKVAEGENVSVTFNFPNDFSQRRAEVITVDRFPLNGSDPTHPEIVLVCLMLDAPNPSCANASKGYRLMGEVKSSLTLRITNVSSEQSGRFICHVLSSEGELLQSEPCSLVVRGLSVVTCKTSPETVAAGDNVTVTFNFPYDVSRRRVVAVIVDRFSLNESDPTEPERVFECLKLDAPNLSCGTRSEGYSLEGEVMTSLTLRITDVSPEHSGHFICYVMSPEKEIPETEPCSLLVRDVLDVSATTTTEPAKPAVTTDLGGQGLDVVMCKMSPKTVTAGDNVSVTFNFPYDVSQTRLVAVTVDRIPLSESDPTDPERVFQGLKLDAQNLSRVTTSEGYSLEGDMKSSLTLRIKDVSPEHSGRFICVATIPERRPLRSEPCSLRVRGSDRNDGVTTPTWMIPVIVTSVILPLIIFAVIFATILLWKSRRADEKNGEDDQGEEKTDGGRGDGEGGAGKDDKDKDAGEENEDKEPLMDAVIIA